MNIQKLFKPYIVKRKNGQCQILIPLVELDELCEKIELNLTGRVDKIVEIQMGQDVFMAYHSLFGDVSDGKGFCTYGWHDVNVVKSWKILRSEICFMYNHGNTSNHLFSYHLGRRILPTEVTDVIESYCGPRS